MTIEWTTTVANPDNSGTALIREVSRVILNVGTHLSNKDTFSIALLSFSFPLEQF